MKLFLVLVTLGGIAMAEETLPERVVFDFEGAEEIRNWFAINDTVMGGVSNSGIEWASPSLAVFRGNVSLENQGGFASVRTRPATHDLSDCTGLVLRVRGDGKHYQFTLKTDSEYEGVTYRVPFETLEGKWQTFEFGFQEFVPMYRGRALSGVQPVNPGEIKTFGFLISGKQEGAFRLEIDWIKARCAGVARPREENPSSEEDSVR